MLDLRGIPTCTCPECGGTLFKALVSFDPSTYMVSSYHLDIECNNCGALATAPTPMDHPINPNNDLGTKE